MAQSGEGHLRRIFYNIASCLNGVRTSLRNWIAGRNNGSAGKLGDLAYNRLFRSEVM